MDDHKPWWADDPELAATAASADPRRQQLLELSRVTDGVAAEVVVEVDEHPQAFLVPSGDPIGPWRNSSSG